MRLGLLICLSVCVVCYRMCMQFPCLRVLPDMPQRRTAMANLESPLILPLTQCISVLKDDTLIIASLGLKISNLHFKIQDPNSSDNMRPKSFHRVVIARLRDELPTTYLHLTHLQFITEIDNIFNVPFNRNNDNGFARGIRC